MFIFRLWSKSVFGLLMLLVLTIAVASRTSAATFTVTKTDDTNDNLCNSDFSLREAIAAANADGSNDVINFAATLFAAPQTITLTGGTQLEVINKGTLTINGSGADLLTLNGVSLVF